MQFTSKYNKGIPFLLSVVDIFSKYTLAVRQILTWIQNIWVKVVNVTEDLLLQRNNIEIYSTHNEGKYAVEE